tara:strand:+ start:588 stop:764 length:177 start_codon:yes stop_codon:yes gene_type:complete
MKNVPRRRQHPQLDQEKNKRKILEKHADKLVEQDKKNKKLSEKLLDRDIFTIFSDEDE